jgi:hypothetical protein
MHTVLISFNNTKHYSKSEYYLKCREFYNFNHPIRHKSNGSLVAMKGCDIWLDYINVTNEELISLLKYIDELPDKELQENIYLKIYFH